jgi:hypothetical protein
MLALFSTRLRTWLLLTVALPLGGVLARALARRIEQRHGETRVTRSLYKASDLVSRRSRAEVSDKPKRRAGGGRRRR